MSYTTCSGPHHGVTLKRSATTPGHSTPGHTPTRSLSGGLPSRIKSCAIKKCLASSCYPPFITDRQAGGRKGRQGSIQAGREIGWKEGGHAREAAA
ncbi:hypothetical protein E2C01_087041 [Portunus trituberculatus]|uniref:Uncharacterized protein n=1 Tax=Portunus trituberculatus TaxID=210409 RepID=A0A5B7JBC2_PORTR|nr:hypothetical protein [Portunus trituberculatus]